MFDHCDCSNYYGVSSISAMTRPHNNDICRMHLSTRLRSSKLGMSDVVACWLQIGFRYQGLDYLYLVLNLL